jgi:hypothetical protein
VKRFFGLEVREQAALGQVHVIGEAANREPAKTNTTGEVECMVENRLTRDFTFRHGRQYNTNVRSIATGAHSSGGLSDP